jgi:hypothetical protein
MIVGTLRILIAIVEPERSTARSPVSAELRHVDEGDPGGRGVTRVEVDPNNIGFT